MLSAWKQPRDSGAEWWIGVGGGSSGRTGREGLSVQLVF